MKHYLMVDLGTGNSRVALVDSDGGILGLRTYTNVYHRDSAYEDGQYFLPEDWAALLLQGCRELCREHPDVQVNAVSAAELRAVGWKRPGVSGPAEHRQPGPGLHGAGAGA